MDQKAIGAFLRALRKERGLTQEQLAEQLGVAGRTVSRWETARNLPEGPGDALEGFLLGAVTGVLVCDVLYLSGKLRRFAVWKRQYIFKK